MNLLLRSGFLSGTAATLFVSGSARRRRSVDFLNQEGFELTHCSDPDLVPEILHQQWIDLILLDLDADADAMIALCRVLRRDPQTNFVATIMIANHASDRQMITGLYVGADDVITVPMDPALLVARLKSVLRRRAASLCGPSNTTEVRTKQPPSATRVGDLVIRSDTYEAYFQNHRLDLTLAEFRLLRFLATRPGQVFSREQIVTALHDQHTEVTDRSVDTRVYALRKKLGGAEGYVETVRGLGYRLLKKG